MNGRTWLALLPVILYLIHENKRETSSFHFACSSFWFIVDSPFFLPSFPPSRMFHPLPMRERKAKMSTGTSFVPSGIAG